MTNNKKGTPILVVLLPGDNVSEHIIASSYKLGPGLLQKSSQVVATQAGRLDQRLSANGSTVVYFVRPNLRRYRPFEQDRVVGIVQDRMGSDGAGGDLYRVDLGGAQTAVLSSLAFEGATKRNKPSLQLGQVIYARVESLNENIVDPTLSCQLGPHDAGLPRKDWMTAEGCYGELRGGTLCKIPTGLARELLHPDNTVLAELEQQKLAFEVAIGVNGFLWIHSSVPAYTILIQNALVNSQVMTEAQVRAMVKQLVYTVRKKMQQDHDAMEE